MKKGLIVLCILSLLFAVVFAAADKVVYTEGYFYYTITDKSITITGYFGKEAVVTIPSSIAGVPVNAIGPNVFAGTSVQIIYLPDTVRELGENAAGTAEVRYIGQETPEPTQKTAEPVHTPAATATTVITPTPAPTDNPEVTANTESPATEAAATASPEPTSPDPTLPAADTASPEPTSTSVTTDGPEQTLPATTEPAQPTEAVTAGPDATPTPDGERSNVSDNSGKGMPVWAWVLIGAAVLIGVAGALTAALRKQKK